MCQKSKRFRKELEADQAPAECSRAETLAPNPLPGVLMVSPDGDGAYQENLTSLGETGKVRNQGEESRVGWFPLVHTSMGLESPGNAQALLLSLLG